MAPQGTLSCSDLEGLYHEHRKALYICALAVTRCPDSAEDAIHEAFRRLLVRNPWTNDLKAYVFRAVRNAAIDEVRRCTRRKMTYDNAFASLSPRGCESPVHREFAEQVADLLQQLREEERETIMQHLYADLTFAEIAAIQERPLGTVVSWYRRGIEHLRTLLEME